MNLLLIYVLSVSMATIYGTPLCDMDEGVYQTVEDEDKYIVYFIWEFEGGDNRQIPVYFIADCGLYKNKRDRGTDWITPECPAIKTYIDECPDILTTTTKEPITTTTKPTPKPTTERTTPEPTTERTTPKSTTPKSTTSKPTPSPTTSPTTTAIPIPTTAVPIDDYDFLPYTCDSPGYTGFCKKFYYCRPTSHGYEKKEKFCPDGPPNEMFNPDYGTCTPKIHEDCEPFICPYPGFFRHPRNCMYYISCPDVGGGQTSDGSRKLHKCPDGYFYKNEQGSQPCVLAHSAAKCNFPGDVPKEESLDSDSVCRVNGEGMYEIESDQTSFRMCMRQHGKDVGLIEACPDGTHFHGGSRAYCTV